MLKDTLKKLGFHENEISAYLALFELGKVRAGKIIEHTKLHRNLVYTSLESLLTKGLVSKVLQKGVAVFEANSPGTLVDLMEEKKNLALDVATELQKKQEKIPTDIKVYEGLEGLVRARYQMLETKPGEMMYVLGATRFSSTPEYETLWKKFHKKRIAKGKPMKILFENVNNQDISESIDWRNRQPITEARKMPFMVDTPVFFSFCEDILDINILSGSPFTFSIRSAEAVKGFKKYFDYFWNSNTITLRGEEGAKIFMEDTLNQSDVYWIGGNGGIEKFHPRVWADYRHRRIDKKVFWHDLVDPNMVLSSTEPGRTIETEPFYESKTLPENVAGPHVICIYGNKVANIVWQKESVITIIEDEKVAASYKKYFDFLWSQEMKVETGMEALEHAFYGMLNELKTGEEYYVLGASTNTYDTDEGNNKVASFFNDVHKTRIKKGITVKMLAYREYMKRGRQRFVDCGDPTGRVSFIKPFISTPRIPMQINLYNNKTLIIFYGEKPSVLTFERPEMYAGFKAYFDNLWNQENYVLKGASELQKIWLESIDTGGMRQIGPRGYLPDRYPELMGPILEKMKNKKGVYCKFICDPSMRKHTLLKYPWIQTKFTLAYTKNFNVVWLWGSKVAIVNWAEDEPIIFVSENKHLVQSNNDYFEELWGKNNN